MRKNGNLGAIREGRNFCLAFDVKVVGCEKAFLFVWQFINFRRCNSMYKLIECVIHPLECQNLFELQAGLSNAPMLLPLSSSTSSSLSSSSVADAIEIRHILVMVLPLYIDCLLIMIVANNQETFTWPICVYAFHRLIIFHITVLCHSQAVNSV